MKFNQFFKDKTIYLISVLIISLLLIFTNPNIIIGILSCIVFCITSVILMYKNYQKEIELKSNLASYNFFSSFLSSLLLQKSCKTSYESACRYILGYTKSYTYEEIIENPSLINLHSYQEYFDFIISKEKSNSILLPDYTILIQDIDNAYNKIANNLTFNNRCLRLSILSYILFLLIFVVILSTNNMISSALKSTSFCILSGLILAIGLPLLLFLNYRNFKELTK